MKAPVAALALAPGGTHVVAGSQDGLAILRWPPLDQPKRTAPTFDNIHGLAFSPDGRWLAAAGGTPGERGAIEIRRWPTLEVAATLAMGKDVAYAAAWSADGTGILAAGGDGAARRFAWPGGTLRQTLDGHSRAVRAAAFVGGAPITAGADGAVRVWHAETGKELRTLANHTDAVHALAVRPRHGGLPMAASCGADGTVRLWQPTIGRMVRFARLPAEPLALAWAPDGTRLGVACMDGSLRELDPDTAMIVRTAPGFAGPAFALVAAAEAGWCLGGERGQLMRRAAGG